MSEDLHGADPLCMLRIEVQALAACRRGPEAPWNLLRSSANLCWTEQSPCWSVGPPYVYDYNVNTRNGSTQQSNTSTYYDAQKHAFMQPGTAGWFEWTYNGNSGALVKRRSRTLR